MIEQNSLISEWSFLCYTGWVYPSSCCRAVEKSVNKDLLIKVIAIFCIVIHRHHLCSQDHSYLGGRSHKGNKKTDQTPTLQTSKKIHINTYRLRLCKRKQFLRLSVLPLKTAYYRAELSRTYKKMCLKAKSLVVTVQATRGLWRLERNEVMTQTFRISDSVSLAGTTF